MKLLVLLITFVVAGFAQHRAGLVWDDSVNPAGTTYNVYRADGLCGDTPASKTYTQIAAGVLVENYTDTTVAGSSPYCYYVTAVQFRVESAASNYASATVPPYTGLILKGAVRIVGGTAK